MPGAGPGDNVAFLWNAWHFDQWHRGLTPGLFTTDRLFAPFGTSLVLHTHTLLPSATAALLPFDSLTVRHNAVLLLGLALNGLVTYALAWKLVRQFIPALLAGLLFSGSAYISVHLPGHINLVHAWVIPLCVGAWISFEERPTVRRGVALGFAAAAVVYTDYYYAVYAALGVVVLGLRRFFAVRVQTERRDWNGWLTGAAVAVAMLALLAAAIAVSGDLSFNAPGTRVLLRHTRNPVAIAFLVTLVSGLYLFNARLSVRRIRDGESRSWWRGVLAAGITSAMVTLPLAVAAARLIARGDYVGPSIFWRSSPPGVDFATAVLGHPQHILTGEWTRSLTAGASINLIEQNAWVGLVGLVVLWRAGRFGPWPAAFNDWRRLAVLFAALAAGPFLRLGGFDTGIPLPWALLRYVPVLSNARIPGRAMIVVTLAFAILVAYAVARLRTLPRIAVAVALLVEMLPGPVALYRLPDPDAVDAAIRDYPQPGAVAELPAGLRDGFGEVGRFDHRALVHQMYHGRPLLGGFVARLPPPVSAQYMMVPGAAQILEGGSSFDPSSFARLRVSMVVLNTDAVERPENFRRTLKDAGFRLMVRAGPRELYCAPR